MCQTFQFKTGPQILGPALSTARPPPGSAPQPHTNLRLRHHLIRLCITTAIARATADTVGAIHLGRPRIDLRCITPSCAR